MFASTLPGASCFLVRTKYLHVMYFGDMPHNTRYGLSCCGESESGRGKRAFKCRVHCRQHESGIGSDDFVLQIACVGLGCSPVVLWACRTFIRGAHEL